MSKPFTASQFTATQHTSADDKAKFANTLVAFIGRGFRETMFTKSLYQRLSNCFGHIAHFNKDGFYCMWFEDEAKQRDWVKNALAWPCYGSPEFTFCDVERAVIGWLRQNKAN